MACLCAHPAHEHRAISQARGPAARTQRALKLATAALAATAGVPAPKPHLPASRLASALTLCASDSVSRCRLQRCELPILMLMLALPTNGLFALRCVDALAPLLILLFNFFDLLTIGTLISQPAALPRAARCSPPSPACCSTCTPPCCSCCCSTYLLLILLLALRGCGAAAARMLLHAATGGRSPQLQRAQRRRQLCGSCGRPPPPCRSLFEDKASV